MAAQEWKTADKGIRYREHPKRRHGVKPDRYFTLRFYVDGKRVEEALGWASDGWTLEKARAELIKLKEARRLGNGPQTLQEQREDARVKREEKKQEELRQQRAAVTFGEYWEHNYLPSQTHKKPQTMASEKRLYRLWLENDFALLPLAQITPDMLDGLKRKMQEAGKSARTIQYTLAIFSQVWNHAFDRDAVSGTNPCRRVKKPKVDNRRMRFLTVEEAQKLLAATAEISDDLYGTALLSLGCGLRAGEIHALTWADVDMANGLLFIRDPKSGKNRHAYMTEEVRAMLQKREAGQTPSELVFPSRNGGMRSQVSKTFGDAVAALGLNDGITDRRQQVVFHTLRHTFASWLVQRGTPIYTVAALMGHSTLEMTQRYAHLAEDTTRNVALGLSGLLTPSMNPEGLPSA